MASRNNGREFVAFDGIYPFTCETCAHWAPMLVGGESNLGQCFCPLPMWAEAERPKDEGFLIPKITNGLSDATQCETWKKRSIDGE